MKASYMGWQRQRAAMARDWRKRIPAIARAASDVLPGAKVYVFGSAARGDMVGGSDVDVLVVSPDLPERALTRAEIKVRIEGEAELPEYHPFELHLVTEREAQPFIRRAGRDVILISENVRLRQRSAQGTGAKRPDMRRP